MVQQHQIVPAMYASTVQGTSTIGDTACYTKRAQVVPSDFAGTIGSSGTILPPLLCPQCRRHAIFVSMFQYWYYSGV